MVRISARDFATIENGRYGQFVEEHMNTQEKEIGQAFIEQARYLLQQEYGPRLQRCLEEMSEEDLWWRPNEHCNSAGNLILHVCGNARQWIISGVGGTPDTRQRSKEFAERGPLAKAALQAKLRETLSEIDRVLAGFPAERLTESNTIQGFAVTNLKAIFHVAEHFGQHLGQVIYLTKMRKDLDLRFYNL
jgi:uncharacterized damage-inducible protein DinB